MNILVCSIALPIISALPCFVFRRASAWIAFIISILEIMMAVMLFFVGTGSSVPIFNPSGLSTGMFLAASVYTLLIVIYSLRFMADMENIGEYYGFILVTIGAAAGAFFSNDYFTLLSFWGALGATLYMLIGIGGPDAASAAKKTFIIVGGSDALMIFGIGAVWLMTRSLQIGIFAISVSGWLPAVGFLALLSGSLAKAGAMPFHSWIPDCAETAPIPVTAYLPASLDKLLGIYLLFRLCTEIYLVTPNSPASILLLAIGSFTIIAGVMAALVQHNIRKLLSFHAVSQVGYMVLGIGTALPIGMAGALFHMLNHTIYKSCLFLTSGSVEKQTGTGELDDLGGLAKFMPITFISASIAALSISGVPPFNGFFSKWMIYQGIIGLSGSSRLWIIWLCAAMFGSALTLASFVKLIHSVYLGQVSDKNLIAKEVHWTMWLPPAILAASCLIIGIFAYSVPLADISIFTGSWEPGLAAVLLLIGLLIGLLIYLFGKDRTAISRPPYVGGELIDEPEVKVPATGFYDTIRDYGPLDRIYILAEKKLFDVYELGKRLVSALYDIFGFLHNGILHTYLAWMFLGFAVLILFLLF